MDRLQSRSRRSLVSLSCAQINNHVILCYNSLSLPVVMPIIPIIPSINTCMSLTTPTTASTTTTASFTPKLPELNTNELQALADVCSNIVPNNALPSPGFGSATAATDLMAAGIAGASTTVVSSGTSLTMSSIATPIPNLLMNSLVSPTKIITDEPVLNPMMASVAMPDKLPVACLAPPVSVIETIEEQRDFFVPAMEQDADVSEKELPEPIEDEEPMEECTHNTVSLSSPKHPSSLKSDDVVMTENLSGGSGMTVESADSNSLEVAAAEGQVTVDDLHLLCDLFYLPFEHGTISLVLLSEFHWLKNNASVLVHEHIKSGSDVNKPEAMEWNRRATKFENISQRVFELARKIVRSRNQEIVHELYSYFWELTSVLELLVGYVRWLKLGQFPANINNFTQGSYTCKEGGVV